MAYKDAEKRKEREKVRSKNYRNRRKGVTKGVTETVGMTEGITPEFISGMANWVRLRGKLTVPEISKIKNIEKAVVKRSAAHHPSCKCFVCNPPKEK
jgi:hypothetical protein